MKRSDFRYAERLRVRWAEIDAQKIVFNGHYLMYLDTAVAGYWRAIAMPYASTMEALEGDMFVRKATLEYFASARYDEVIDVALRCARVGNSSMTFEGGIFLRDRLLVSGEIVYVFADPETQRSRPVPAVLRETLLGFEDGEPMIDVRVGDWAALGEQARPIRLAVFVDEQQIPADLEWDAADATATHAVAFNRFGAALATGRLIEPAAGVGQIGRMAVLASMRGQAHGRAVLDALVATARDRGLREVVLHAQQSAVAFYARAGFQPRGPAYEEVGIPHQEMVLPL